MIATTTLTQPTEPPFVLPAAPRLPAAQAERLVADWERGAALVESDLPAYLRSAYQLDITGQYAGAHAQSRRESLRAAFPQPAPSRDRRSRRPGLCRAENGDRARRRR